MSSTIRCLNEPAATAGRAAAMLGIRRTVPASRVVCGPDLMAANWTGLVAGSGAVCELVMFDTSDGMFVVTVLSVRPCDDVTVCPNCSCLHASGLPWCNLLTPFTPQLSSSSSLGVTGLSHDSAGLAHDWAGLAHDWPGLAHDWAGLADEGLADNVLCLL